jgi:hypothetical protein
MLALRFRFPNAKCAIAHSDVILIGNYVIRLGAYKNYQTGCVFWILACLWFLNNDGRRAKVAQSVPLHHLLGYFSGRLANVDRTGY